jgi:hypothetical protein
MFLSLFFSILKVDEAFKSVGCKKEKNELPV